jgi:hypothetical protein
MVAMPAPPEEYTNISNDQIMSLLGPTDLENAASEADILQGLSLDGIRQTFQWISPRVLIGFSAVYKRLLAKLRSMQEDDAPALLLPSKALAASEFLPYAMSSPPYSPETPAHWSSIPNFYNGRLDTPMTDAPSPFINKAAYHRNFNPGLNPWVPLSPVYDQSERIVENSFDVDHRSEAHTPRSVREPTTPPAQITAVMSPVHATNFNDAAKAYYESQIDVLNKAKKELRDIQLQHRLPLTDWSQGTTTFATPHEYFEAQVEELNKVQKELRLVKLKYGLF